MYMLLLYYHLTIAQNAQIVVAWKKIVLCILLAIKSVRASALSDRLCLAFCFRFPRIRRVHIPKSVRYLLM